MRKGYFGTAESGSLVFHTGLSVALKIMFMLTQKQHHVSYSI